MFTTVLAVGWPAIFGVRPRRGVVASLSAAAIIAQVQVEGYRWQLLPLYVLAAGLAVGDILYVDRRLVWSRRLARGIFGSLTVALAAALPLLLPVPSLPVPSGALPVGTVSVVLVDPERQATYGPEPEGPRRLMAQVWYPAQSVAGQKRVEWSKEWDVVAPAMARRLRLPGWFLDHTRYTLGHSVESAPVAAGSYPVVIYSHGWTGFRTIAVNQAESLASNGYVVIAVDHTYAAVTTRFPDGEVVGYRPEALPPEADGREAHLIAADLLIETMAGDIGSVLDLLALGADGPFAFVSGGADMARVGVYGHSAGGGAAVRFCLVDTRCDAVLGFDPWVEPFPMRILRDTLSVPALFMRSDGWRAGPNDATLRGIAGRSGEIVYWVGVTGAGHNDFVVTPLFSPVAASLGLRGPISAGRILPIVDNYLVGFFDVYLRDTGSAALDTVRFPEVILEVIHP